MVTKWVWRIVQEGWSGRSLRATLKFYLFITFVILLPIAIVLNLLGFDPLR